MVYKKPKFKDELTKTVFNKGLEFFREIFNYEEDGIKSKEIYIFGSVAEGKLKTRETPDIDTIVVFPDELKNQNAVLAPFIIRDMAKKFTEKYGIKIDLDIFYESYVKKFFEKYPKIREKVIPITKLLRN